jgi:hypothetical protein
MKNIKFYLLMLFASVGLTMCQKSDIGPGDSSVLSSPQEQFTGTTPQPEICPGCTECKLYAGQTIESGTVKVCNDRENLYVTYKTTGSFETLHLWVGTDLADKPSTKNGTPIPGQFPYKYDVNGGNTYTFTIPLNDIKGYTAECGEQIYVIAHAENTINGRQETAFGGCIPVNVNERGRWYYYMVHTIPCCPPPPPTCNPNNPGCSQSQGYYFAKPNVEWPGSVTVGGTTVNKAGGQQIWDNLRNDNCITARAFFQAATIELATADEDYNGCGTYSGNTNNTVDGDVALINFLLEGINLTAGCGDDELESHELRQLQEAAGRIGDWINAHHCN